MIDSTLAVWKDSELDYHKRQSVIESTLAVWKDSELDYHKRQSVIDSTLAVWKDSELDYHNARVWLILLLQSERTANLITITQEFDWFYSCSLKGQWTWLP